MHVQPLGDIGAACGGVTESCVHQPSASPSEADSARGTGHLWGPALRPQVSWGVAACSGTRPGCANPSGPVPFDPCSSHYGDKRVSTGPLCFTPEGAADGPENPRLCLDGYQIQATKRRGGRRGGRGAPRGPGTHSGCQGPCCPGGIPFPLLGGVGRLLVSPGRLPGAGREADVGIPKLPTAFAP